MRQKTVTPYPGGEAVARVILGPGGSDRTQNQGAGFGGRSCDRFRDGFQRPLQPGTAAAPATVD